MSKIMNEENEWDQIADADSEEGPIKKVMRGDNGGIQILEDWNGACASRGSCRNDSS